MINIGSTEVINIYIGDTPATAVYIGDMQIWGAGGKDYSKEYFTLSALESGDFYWNVSNVEYSLNDGAWTTWTATDSANTLSVSADDKVRFRSSANTSYNGLTINATGQFDVEGNSMSLFYGDNFIGQTAFQGGTYNFMALFSGNTYLVNAENLILPAISLTAWATYQSMFQGCTSLTKAPELPATSVGNGAYLSMFSGCISLTKAPTILPTISFGSSYNCYKEMFRGCTSLTTAPELPATVITQSTYSGMFRDCSSLNYIKCLATDISASFSTQNFSRGVSATGTFIKDANMVDWTTGVNGIPSGWTIIDN